MPSPAPSSVGTVTDQPMSPIIPSPDQTIPTGWRCAASLRATLASICCLNFACSGALSLVGGLGTMQRRQSADQIGFDLDQR